MRPLAEAGHEVGEERPGRVEQMPAAGHLRHRVDAPAQPVGARVRVAVDQPYSARVAERPRHLASSRAPACARPASPPARPRPRPRRSRASGAPRRRGGCWSRARPPPATVPGCRPPGRSGCQASARSTAATSPSTSCGSASTTGSTPCSRSVAVVTGPIDAAAQPVEPAVAERRGEVRHGRRRRERDQVGRRAPRRRRPARARCGRAGPRRRRRPPSRSPSGSTSRAPSAVATSTRLPGDVAERLEQRLGDGLGRHHVGRRSRGRAAPAPSPGRSPPPARRAARRTSPGSSSSTPFALVRQTTS